MNQMGHDAAGGVPPDPTPPTPTSHYFLPPLPSTQPAAACTHCEATLSRFTRWHSAPMAGLLEGLKSDKFATSANLMAMLVSHAAYVKMSRCMKLEIMLHGCLDVTVHNVRRYAAWMSGCYSAQCQDVSLHDVRTWPMASQPGSCYAKSSCCKLEHHTA
eukprot:727225-Pelagomonas_calceolata.AAC.2